MPDFFEEPIRLPLPADHLAAVTAAGRTLRARYRLRTAAVAVALLATSAGGLALAHARSSSSGREILLDATSPIATVSPQPQPRTATATATATVLDCLNGGATADDAVPGAYRPVITAGQALVAIAQSGLDEAISRQLPALALVEVSGVSTLRSSPSWVAVVTGFDLTRADFPRPAVRDSPSPSATSSSTASEAPIYRSQYIVVGADSGVVELSSFCLPGRATAPQGWAATPLFVRNSGAYTLTVPIPAGVRGLTLGDGVAQVVGLPDAARYLTYTVARGIRVVHTATGLVAEVRIDVTGVHAAYPDFTLWLTPAK